jgi:hypothetical protein
MEEAHLNTSASTEKHGEHQEEDTRIKQTTKSDQKENKPRVLPHLLFYRNVCLTLIVY